MKWWKQFLEGCMIPGFWNRTAESTNCRWDFCWDITRPRGKVQLLFKPLKLRIFRQSFLVCQNLHQTYWDLMEVSLGGGIFDWTKHSLVIQDFLNIYDVNMSHVIIQCTFVYSNVCICDMYVYIYLYMHRYVFTCIHHILFESICIFQTMIMMSLLTSVIVVVPKALVDARLIVVSTGVSIFLNLYIYIVEVTCMVRVFVVHVLCRHLYFELAHQGFCAR